MGETIANFRDLPPKEMLAKVLDAIRQFSGHAEFSDDICLLAMEVKQVQAASAGGLNGGSAKAESGAHDRT